METVTNGFGADARRFAGTTRADQGTDARLGAMKLRDTLAGLIPFLVQDFFATIRWW